MHKEPLVVEQNNYAIKLVHAYIAYELDTWPKVPLNNFSDKPKCVYSGYGIAFGGAGSWSFGNEFARNVVIFGVNNSS